MPKRLDIEFVRKEFAKRGYKLLSSEYKNSRQKLDYICNNGHRHSIKWDHFRDGHGCPYCANRPPLTIELVKQSFESEGYKLLTDVYINSNQKLTCVCPKGHRYKVRWNNWSSGYRCPYCSGKVRKDIYDIEKHVNNNGYDLLTKYYKNCTQKLHLVCPNGHDYYVSWDNWNSKDCRCPKCNNIGVSKQELTLINFIKSIYKKEIFEHDRKLIAPYELDVVIPTEKIAIEYCGLYWHSELVGKDEKYHLSKLNLCEEKGYRLLTIFEDELIHNENVVFSRLKDILRSDNLNVIYARNCNIKPITTRESRLFCERNHLQGYQGSNIKLGAFYGNDLVSVMTFSKPSIAKGCRNYNDGNWELNRFCSKIDYRIVGIASRLLKYFERNYDWEEIFSYADRRWSDGNLYKRLGFNLVGATKPNYWYLKKQSRIHRFALRKTMNDPVNISEWGIRRSQGYNRIWDCGSLKYVKKLA